MDIEKTLADMLNLMERGYKQTRNGAHLREENVQQAIDAKKNELTQKMEATASSIKSNKQIQDESTALSDKLKKLGVPLSERTQMLKDNYLREKKFNKRGLNT